LGREADQGRGEGSPRRPNRSISLRAPSPRPPARAGEVASRARPYPGASGAMPDHDGERPVPLRARQPPPRAVAVHAVSRYLALDPGFSECALVRVGRDARTKVGERGGGAAARTDSEAADHRAVHAVSRYLALDPGFAECAPVRVGRDARTKVGERGGRAAARTNAEAADHRAVHAVSGYMALSPGASECALVRVGRDARTKAATGGPRSGHAAVGPQRGPTLTAPPAARRTQSHHRDKRPVAGVAWH